MTDAWKGDIVSMCHKTDGEVKSSPALGVLDNGTGVWMGVTGQVTQASRNFKRTRRGSL